MITNPTPLPYNPTQVSTMQQYPTPATLTPGASAIYSQLQQGQPTTLPAQQPAAVAPQGAPVAAPPQQMPAQAPQWSAQGGVVGNPETQKIASPMLNQAQQAISTAVSQEPGRVIYPGARNRGVGVPRPGPSVRGVPGRPAPAPLMVA